jgi:quinol monooxygenase YgiN
VRGVEVSVRMKVRAGQLAGLEEQATSCIEQTRERDTKTLRYDWYLSEDGTRCEIREAYVDSDGVIEHRIENVRDATNELFSKFADDPVVTMYGERHRSWWSSVTRGWATRSGGSRSSAAWIRSTRRLVPGPILLSLLREPPERRPKRGPTSHSQRAQN